jgi:hypothetical protein
MKCEVIREDLEVSPAYADLPELQDRIVRIEKLRNGALRLIPFWKRGAVLEHPEAYKLVRQGCAVPADEACAIRANRNPSEIRLAQKAYERVNRGIHPEDYDKFDAGIILGYTPTGDYVPGPNWNLLKQTEDDDEEDE